MSNRPGLLTTSVLIPAMAGDGTVNDFVNFGHSFQQVDSI